MTETNDWDEWRNHVLRTQDRLEAKVDQLVVDMANVKAAAKLWGSVTSLIVTPIIVGVIMLAIAAFTK